MNKKIFLTVIILISIILIVGGVYLKMKYDEQKERITLYMKYNVKDFKNIEFTEFKKNPMDGYDISGYINKDKNLSFSVGIRSTENFQFNGNISYSEELENKFIKNTKTVSQIKKEHR